VRVLCLGCVGNIEEILHLSCLVVFIATEDIALGALGEAQLVDLNVCTVSDESDEGILRQKVEGLL